MAPPKIKRLSLSKKKEPESNSRAFLNSLSADEADLWREELITTDPHSLVINYRHLPLTVTIDQLKSFRNILPYDCVTE